jgi:hypothetical protein
MNNYVCTSVDPLTITLFNAIKSKLKNVKYIENEGSLVSSLHNIKTDVGDDGLHKLTVDDMSYKFKNGHPFLMYRNGSREILTQYHDSSKERGYTMTLGDFVHVVKLNENKLSGFDTVREVISKYPSDRNILTKTEYSYLFYPGEYTIPAKISITTTNRVEDIERVQLLELTVLCDKTEDKYVDYMSISIKDVKTKEVTKLIGFYYIKEM